MSFDLKNQDKFAYQSWNWYQNRSFYTIYLENKFAIGGGISYDVFNGTDLITGFRRKTDSLIPTFS
jgi:NTE family protein